MKAKADTLTREQALRKWKQDQSSHRQVEFLYKLDKSMIFRGGKADASKVDKIRFKEDERAPVNERTGEEKKNDIITFKKGNDLWVLGKSGGVSLWDGINPSRRMRGSDRWWILLDNPDLDFKAMGLVVAKDISPTPFKQENGQELSLYHYGIWPDEDMPYEDYLAKLKELEAHMKIYQA